MAWSRGCLATDVVWARAQNMQGHTAGRPEGAAGAGHGAMDCTFEGIFLEDSPPLYHRASTSAAGSPSPVSFRGGRVCAGAVDSPRKELVPEGAGAAASCRRPLELAGRPHPQ